VARVFSLSIHADYRCRHSGNCCSADWDVPVELPIYRSLADAVASGRLAPSRRARDVPSAFLVDPAEPEDAAAVFERTATGECVFLETGSNLCIIHRDLGADALPITCRVFPRVSVDDARGTHITLSHFCPTAASMLFRDDVPLAIVDNPPAFPPANYDGLVVGDDDLPPLLTPHMLMDHEGYSAWEAHLVARCADGEPSPESLLATMMRDARALGGWRPGGMSLRDAIAALPRELVSAPPQPTLDASLAMHREVMAAVPDDLKPAGDEADLPAAYLAYVLPRWRAWRAPVNRFIAAKSFATWTAYQGRGVATIVRGIEAAVALVRVEASRLCRDAGRPLDRALLLEAFRAADFALNHLAVGEDLAAAWSAVEDL
jgi:hypothetical protein